MKPGGEIVVDADQLYWKRFMDAKFYLRPFTRQLSQRSLYKFCRFHVSWVYPFTGLLQKLIGRPGRSASWVLGMVDDRGVIVAIPGATA